MCVYVCVCVWEESVRRRICAYFSVRAADIVTLSSYLVHVKIILSDVNMNLESVERLVWLQNKKNGLKSEFQSFGFFFEEFLRGNSWPTRLSFCLVA